MNARHRSAESSGARAASSAESSTGHPPAGFLSSGELLGLLYQGLPAALTANGLIALALMAVQWQVVDGHRAIAWLIAMSAILALRAGLYLGYRRSAADPSAAGDKWLTPFRLGTIITGVLWGAATPVFYPHGDLAHQLALTFVLSGVCAGAATTLAADRVSALGFIGPTLLPVMIALLAEGGDIRLMMGSLGALFRSSSAPALSAPAVTCSRTPICAGRPGSTRNGSTPNGSSSKTSRVCNRGSSKGCHERTCSRVC